MKTPQNCHLFCHFFSEECISRNCFELMTETNKGTANREEDKSCYRIIVTRKAIIAELKSIMHEGASEVGIEQVGPIEAPWCIFMHSLTQNNYR